LTPGIDLDTGIGTPTFITDPAVGTMRLLEVLRCMTLFIPSYKDPE